MLDAQSGETTSTDSVRHNGAFKSASKGYETAHDTGGHADTGGASRFFYTAKASRAEREAGLSGPTRNVNDGRTAPHDTPYQRGDTLRLKIFQENTNIIEPLHRLKAENPPSYQVSQVSQVSIHVIDWPATIQLLEQGSADKNRLSRRQ